MNVYDICRDNAVSITMYEEVYLEKIKLMVLLGASVLVL